MNYSTNFFTVILVTIICSGCDSSATNTNGYTPVAALSISRNVNVWRAAGPVSYTTTAITLLGKEKLVFQDVRLSIWLCLAVDEGVEENIILTRLLRFLKNEVEAVASLDRGLSTIRFSTDQTCGTVTIERISPDDASNYLSPPQVVGKGDMVNCDFFKIVVEETKRKQKQARVGKPGEKRGRSSLVDTCLSLVII